MKKIITILCSCFIAVCLLVSCKEQLKNAPAEMKGTQSDTVMPQNGIHLDTAILNIQRYVNSCRRYFSGSTSDSIIRSYTVSATDLFGVMQLNPHDTLEYSQCRVYLGLDYKMRFKLYFTPARGTEDIILYYLNSKKDTVRYVYDLNAPCPSTCAVNSRLNAR